MAPASAAALTRDEFLAATTLSRRPVRRGRSTILVDVWVTLVAAGSAVAGVAAWQLLARTSAGWVVGILLGAVLIRIGLQLRAVPGKAWDNNEPLRATRRGSISEEAVVLETKGGESRLTWEDLTGYGEVGDMVVLFYGSLGWMPFPRRVFRSEDGWGAFRGLVSRKLERSHGIRGDGLGKPSRAIVALLVVMVIAVAIVVLDASASK